MKYRCVVLRAWRRRVLAEVWWITNTILGIRTQRNDALRFVLFNYAFSTAYVASTSNAICEWWSGKYRRWVIWKYGTALEFSRSCWTKPRNLKGFVTQSMKHNKYYNYFISRSAPFAWRIVGFDATTRSMNRNSSVKWLALGVRFPVGIGMFLFGTMSRPPLGPTEHHQWVPVALSTGECGRNARLIS